MAISFAGRSSQAFMSKQADYVRKQLRIVDRKLITEMDRANRQAAKPILEKAKEYVPASPLSNWSKYGWRRRGEGQNALQWSANAVQRGFRLRAGKRSSYTNKKALLQFRNMSGQGVIFEIAGRGKSQGTSPQGKAMVRNLLQKWPRVSRTLWRAVDEIGVKELQQAIISNYNEAIAKANAKIRSTGSSMKQLKDL